MSKHWMLAALLAALAGCSDKPAPTGESTPPAATAPLAAPALEPVAAATHEVATDAALQVADLDAFIRGMGREVALLQAGLDKIEQARAANDSDAETQALFEMTGPDIDQAGATAAGLSPARYGHVKNRIDEVQSKLDILEGFRKMDADTSALQAQLGDPYAGLAADVAAALKARQARIAELRATSIGLRVKAAGG